MNLLVNRLPKVGISLIALMLNFLPMPAGAHTISADHAHGGCSCSYTYNAAVWWKKLLGIKQMVTNKCHVSDNTVYYPDKGQGPSCDCDKSGSTCTIA